ncbi:hypothetical protein QLX08_004239 [Tetragonisca angustula]|uniref:Uncharacterized protein n=1 Tax=Tetragonisca angustula TaxID=166442 RepID=A0AAW1A2X9_9HYME
MLEQRAQDLMFSDAKAMFEIIGRIRKEFNESANKPVNSNKLIADIKTADNLFGLKFEYTRATVNEKLRIMPTRNKIQIVGNSTMKCRNEETSLKIEPKFEWADYEKRLKEYANHFSTSIYGCCH